MVEANANERLTQKFLALEMWAHRALDLSKLGITNEEKIKEAMQMCQRCLNECKDIYRYG